jgi:hypothetical protein
MIHGGDRKRQGGRKEGPLPLRTRVVVTIGGHEEWGWIQGRTFGGTCLYDIQFDAGHHIIGVPAASVLEVAA